MSNPQEIRSTHEAATTPTSPISASPLRPFLIPSPLPTKRSRTYSASERALAGPSYRGVIKEFCRNKGHGFIKTSDGDIFLHISDIDGEYVPKAGDEVSYKKCLIPPKNDKYSAVHVQIVHCAEGVKHERWDTPAVDTAFTPEENDS